MCIRDSSHGVNTGEVQKDDIIGQPVLPEQLRTLPELMKAAGYATYGATENGHLSAQFGFGRGFDGYWNGFFVNNPEAPKKIVELTANSGPGPKFLWIHLFTPHSPYHAQEPWATQWAEEAGVSEDIVPTLDMAESYSSYHYKKDGPELKALVARYDSEIRASDEAIARALKQLDPNDEAMLVVTADHGEEFLEHDNFGHRTHYPEVIEIPLLVRYPNRRGAGTTSTRLASLLDVGPTILREAGVEVPIAWQGTPLQDLQESAGIPDNRKLLFYTASWQNAKLQSLRDRSHILHAFFRASSISELLFDLSQDPKQIGTPLVQPNTLSALQNAMKKMAAAYSAEMKDAPRPSILSKEQAERLRTLGYLN